MWLHLLVILRRQSLQTNKELTGIAMWVYVNEKYVEREYATISVFDRGFLFSDGVYEVIRFYPGYGYFESEAHLNRLQYGLEQLRINGVDLGRIRSVTEELLKRNDHAREEAIAYIQVTRGSSYPRQHFFPPRATPPTVFISTNPFKPHQDEIEKGTSVLLQEDIRWSRCDIKTIALLPNVLSRQDAVEQGVSETIWSRDGVITEGTHTNFCAFKGGMMLTHPQSHRILSGITRKVVFRICQSLNIPVKEIPIKESELEDVDECIIIGTTTEITPVVRINDIIIGTGLPGELTLQIQKAFYEIVRTR